MNGLGIYLINLDRSTERLEAVSESFAEVGLTFERVPGIDGTTLPTPYEGVDEVRYDRSHHKLLRPGEVGCYLSHIKALEAFLDSQNEFGLILEDDVRANPELPHVLEEAVKHADEWDILKLHWTHPGWPVRRAKWDDNIECVSFLVKHAAAAAYIVNRKAAQAIITKLMPMFVPYDHAFDRTWEMEIKMRAVRPHPITRHGFQSTIETTVPHNVAQKKTDKKYNKPIYTQHHVLTFKSISAIKRTWYNGFTDGWFAAFFRNLFGRG